MSSSVADSWTNLPDTRDRLYELLKKLNSPTTYLDIATGLGFGSLHDSPQVRNLSEHAFRTMIEYLQDGFDPSRPFPKFSQFLKGGAQLVALGPSLHDLGDNLRSHMSGFFDALDTAVGAQSRYRLYTIHPSENCYRGLFSRGMRTAYVDEFDVRRPLDFCNTKPIPLSEPRYQRIDGTCCYRLSARDLENILDKDSHEWYREKLGLGTTVPETYTWEFTDGGAANALCIDCAEGKERYVFALSIDMGQRSDPYAERVSDPLLIRLLDMLFRLELGTHLAAGISGVHGRLLVEKAHEGRLSTQALASAAAPAAIRHQEGPTLGGCFKAIPGTKKSKPWVFAKGDSECEAIYDIYQHFRITHDPICFIGAPGVGKDLIAKALHFNGHLRDGPFVEQNYSNIRGNDVRKTVYGCEDGAWTGVGEEAGDFEKANGGTYFINEIFHASPDAQNELLTALDAVEYTSRLRRIGGRSNKRGKQGASTPGREYDAKVRVVYAGNPDRTGANLNEAMARRLDLRVSVPSWRTLSRESRIVIVRWCMLHAVAKNNYQAGQLSLRLFQCLVDELPEILDQENMDKIGNWINRSVTTDADKLQFRWSRLVSFESSLRAGYGRVSEERFPDALWIGVDSAFSQQLNQFEKIVVKITRCTSGAACTGCVGYKELNGALQSLGQVDKGGAFDAHYLLLAAVRNVPRMTKKGTSIDPSDDPSKTAPGQLEKHLETPAAYQNWFQAATTYLPGQVKIRGEDLNGNFPGGPVFRKHVEEDNIEVLLAKTERIACGFPPFLHHVPYWPVG